MQQAQQNKPKRDAAYYRAYRAEKKAEKLANTKEGKRIVASTKRRVIAAAVAKKLQEQPAIALGTALKEVGATKAMQNNPGLLLLNTPEWAEMLDAYLPKAEVLETHRGLLRASKIERIEFPINEVTEQEARDMIESSGCMVRKIVSGEHLRTAYFYAPEHRARKDAIDMVYKLRGSYAADKAAVVFSLAALAASRDAEPAAQDALPPAPNGPVLPPMA